MRKSVFVVATLIAAVSTAAVAKDVKQEKRATGPVQMTDSEMDKVTAGGKFDNSGQALGLGTGAPGNGKGNGAANNSINGRF
jgi:hypothetical protein